MKTIGIIGAMPSELVDIRLGLPDSEIQKKAGFDYYINQVGDTRIVHVCSGIAKVNAAVCTQALIDNFAPDAVINAGIAGGMNNDIHVCDVVVSSEVLPPRPGSALSEGLSALLRHLHRRPGTH